MNVYFDTSTWNHLERHAERDRLIRIIQQHKQLVLASVITVGEVLRTPDPVDRQNICSVMRALHGNGPLLEHPFDLAHAAAQAILQKQEDFYLLRTGPGNYLLHCMLDATQPPPQDEIWAWLSNMEKRWKEARAQLNSLDLNPAMDHLPAVLGHDAFLEILCKLEPARTLAVSVPQMRVIYGYSDLWKALGATVAYMMKPSTTRAPKNIKGKKRAGAQDLWQIPYLGVVGTFVSGDEPMVEATHEISRVASFRYGRSTQLSDRFFRYLLGFLHDS